MAMAGTRLVTLDVTNTIVKVRGGVGSIYKHVAERLGLYGLLEIPVDQINTSFKRSFKQHWSKVPNFGYGEMTAVEWWRNVTNDALLPFMNKLPQRDVTSFYDALYKAFSTADAYQLVPGVKETLAELSSKIDMVVITNNDSRIRSVIRECFGDDMFKRLIISNEVGIYKPDTRLFTKAMEGMDISASQVLHVGDSYVNDYLPAVSLGMKALLLTSTDTDQHSQCDTITEFKQILQFV